MRETSVEKKLKKKVESFGGMCLKWVSPGWNGAPDRICLFPGERLLFVETKATGEKARVLQEKRHKQLRALGFKVLVIDSEDQINEIQAT